MTHVSDNSRSPRSQSNKLVANRWQLLLMYNTCIFILNIICIFTTLRETFSNVFLTRALRREALSGTRSTMPGGAGPSGWDKVAKPFSTTQRPRKQRKDKLPVHWHRSRATPAKSRSRRPWWTASCVAESRRVRCGPASNCPGPRAALLMAFELPTFTDVKCD